MRGSQKCRVSKSSAFIWIILLWIATLALSGCAHTIPLKPIAPQTEGVTKVPLKLGIYYSPQFRNYRHDGSRGGDRWLYSLGFASVNLFDEVFPIVFMETRHVEEHPPDIKGGDDLAAVIEPEIQAFDFKIPFFKTGTYRAEITYRFTLYSLQGDPFASWTVKGIGEQRGKFGFSFSRSPGEAADLAMEDAATNFINGFKEEPEVRRWLRETGVSSLR